MIPNDMSLRKVVLHSDVYVVCLQHALTTEKEEVMGLLIGETDEKNLVSYISACIILHRSDKQPDRVEISPEQLYTASQYAEELTNKLKKPMRVLGWYHSHPHITVWPSHVDVRTQASYQRMDPLFIGLIFSVYQKDRGAIGNNFQLICFQATQDGTERKEIPLEIQDSLLKSYDLDHITGLPTILSQEEVETQENGETDINDPLATLHNDASRTLALVHIVSKVALPLSEVLEGQLDSVNLRIAELERLKKELLSQQ